MTSTTPEAQAASPRSATLPGAAHRAGAGAVPLRGQQAQLLQVALFRGGAMLLPLGLAVTVLGWYGAVTASSRSDQLSYLVSGGLLGLGLTLIGGFLYVGAWLARIAADGRESSSRLADTLLVLAELTSRAAVRGERRVDVSDLRVTAGDGLTMHRHDCSLVAAPTDLAPVGADNGYLTGCRVCRP